MVVQIKYHCDSEIIEWMWSTDNNLLPAPFWTSAFLIDGLLIDSGAPASEDDLRKFINSLDDSEKVKECLITHSHEDHCGGAAMLQEEFNIPVYSSCTAIPLLKKPKDYPDYRRVTWGFPYRPFEAVPVGDSITTGNNKYKFDILEVDGHAKEEIALIEKEKQWAIIADAIMPKYIMIFGKNTDIPEDIHDIYESIKKLDDYTEGMDDLLIFTAGRGIFKGRKIFKDKIQEIEKLHEKAHSIKEQGVMREYKDKQLIKYILKQMFGKENFVGQFTRGDLSTQNLITSLLEWPLD